LDYSNVLASANFNAFNNPNNPGPVIEKPDLDSNIFYSISSKDKNSNKKVVARRYSNLINRINAYFYSLPA
jgi:hypothetical protein